MFTLSYWNWKRPGGNWKISLFSVTGTRKIYKVFFPHVYCFVSKIIFLGAAENCQCYAPSPTPASPKTTLKMRVNPITKDTLLHARPPNFLLQPQSPRPKTRFHHLVINIPGRRRASGNNYTITYGCKCTSTYISSWSSLPLFQDQVSLIHVPRLQGMWWMCWVDGEILRWKYFNILTVEFVSRLLDYCQILVWGLLSP